MVKVGILATACACIGLAGNQLRDKPLPLVYQSKQERMDLTVTSLKQEQVADAPVVTKQMVTAAELPSVLSLDEMKVVADQGEIIVLDARPEIFHRLGHIPGALSLPRDDFEAGYEQIRERIQANKHQPLVIYCSSASCKDSSLIVSALEKLGYTQISVFKGGWAEWQQARLSEEKGQ